VRAEVQRLFAEALAMPEEQQRKYLAAQTDDPEISKEVLSLLAHDRVAQPFFDAVLGSAAASVEFAMDLSSGARLGAYTIERMLGRGGMGGVYLATRADGAFEHKVAIKVIQASRSLSSIQERFRQERQILARLSHPNIARLLDGGETPAGQLYVVLEYVQGEDVNRYCDGHALDLRRRLQLFLQVCGAVHYAHENLIIHRDLKPGNILVGEDGTPKLLDFGIAKVVEPFESGPGGPSTQLFTIEFASPEQVRGDAITTAADIYSLGAILYQLVVSRPLRAFEDLSPLEVVREITEQQAPVVGNMPSEIAAILKKALHLEPSHRYRSAHDFAGDIERYLAGQPVLAVPDSVVYRFRTFFRRHWIPATAAAAVVLSLAIGAGVALWQARRAERRFTDVRQLSNQFLFEFEESIHSVPGAMKARRLVIKTAQQYLDRLAADAGHDRELTRELAEAYRRLGDVQGSPLEGNTGDTQAALASYRRALALRNSVGDDHALDTKTRVVYLLALEGLSDAESTSGDADRALPLSEKAVTLGQSWVHNGSSDPRLLLAAASAYSQLATRQREKGKFEPGVASSKQALVLKQQALGISPDDRKLQRAVATGYWALGSAEKAAGHPEEAVENFKITVKLMNQVAANDPGNVASRREALGASWLLAASMTNLLSKQNKGLEGALPLFEDALRIGNQLLKEDPDNALVEADVASISIGLGSTLQEVGRPRDALSVLAPAVERQKRRCASAPDNRTAAYYLALLHMGTAEAYAKLPDLPAALRSRRSAMDIFERLVRDNPGNYDYQHNKASNLKEAGDVMAALGDYAGARAKYREGLRIAETLPKGPSLLDAAALVAEIREAGQRIAQ
jgi:eukaryotic-like serine/threonine-protein kinase